MPKRAKELSALTVSKLKADGRYAVGGANGLHLRVAGRSRSWVLRVVVGSTRRDMGLGSYPEVSLAEARQRAFQQREQVRLGVDPIESRRTSREQAKMEAAKSKTFSECAEAYIELQRVGWTNPKHAKQWASTLRNYAYPYIGSTVVGRIDSELILKILKQSQPGHQGQMLWECKNETADRIRNRIEQILDWAKFRGYRDGENPARWRGNLDNELPAPGKVQKIRHYPSLPHARVGAFLVDLRSRRAVSARALEFAILTAARSNEVRGAVWSEIDLESKVWTVPADKMKGRRERKHRVPLNSPAIRLLERMKRTGESDLVFSNGRGKHLSQNVLSQLIDAMHIADVSNGGVGYLDPIEKSVAVPHGFRSSFKDWARTSTRGFADEVSELALAHVNSDATRSAYARDELMPLRGKLMDEWARYIGSVVSSNVAQFPAKKKQA